MFTTPTLDILQGSYDCKHKIPSYSLFLVSMNLWKYNFSLPFYAYIVSTSSFANSSLEHREIFHMVLFVIYEKFSIPFHNVGGKYVDISMCLDVIYLYLYQIHKLFCIQNIITNVFKTIIENIFLKLRTPAKFWTIFHRWREDALKTLAIYRMDQNNIDKRDQGDNYSLNYMIFSGDETKLGF